MYKLKKPASYKLAHLNQIESRNDVRTSVQEDKELTADIKRRGLEYPLVVRRSGDARFKVVDGDLRLESVRALRWEQVPVFVHEEMDDKEALEYFLAIETHRHPLDPLEEARAFGRYISEKGWGGATELAERISKSPGYISQRLQLLQLPDTVQNQLFPRGKISVSTAEAMAPLKADIAEVQQIAKLAEQGLSVTEVTQLVTAERRGSPLASLVEKIEGRDRKKQFLRILHRESPTWAEAQQMVRLLKEDKWLMPYSALEQVRRVNAPGRHRYTVEVQDSRIVLAIRMASESTAQSPEEYILDVLLKTLVREGYLKEEVVKQNEVLQFVQHGLETDDPENHKGLKSATTK